MLLLLEDSFVLRAELGGEDIGEAGEERVVKVEGSDDDNLTGVKVSSESMLVT